jgi:hypothetical protein
MAPDKILKALISSKKTGRVVGIRLKKKAKPIVTAVDDLNDHVVQVKESTCYGQTISNRNIPLKDIETVRCFNSYFEDPMFVRLRNLKNSIRKIRSAFT